MNNATPSQLSAFGHYTLAFKKFFVLQGRATRSEYWYFFLFNFIANIVFIVIDGVLASLDIVLYLQVIYYLVALIPNITLTVRRLHDTGRSGWWFGILMILSALMVVTTISTIFSTMQYGLMSYGFMPSSSLLNILTIALVIIGLILFVFMLLDSQPGSNRFGPNPKGINNQNTANHAGGQTNQLDLQGKTVDLNKSHNNNSIVK